ncbi:MAG: TIGR04002 family protein [Lachnospiraceae bacterium]|nr:TIGR04002 family protein [Lachnospiraceae bacterium]
MKTGITEKEVMAVKTSEKVRYMTMAGIMAALITVMTAYICHIPVGVNGGYVHFGDSMIYLAAALLPTPYALAAAAIGGGLADLLTAPMWAPATIIIKMLIALLFTNKGKKIITPRNIAACILAYFVTGIGYFLAEYVIFGSWSVLLAAMSETLIQSGGSAVFFIVFGAALDKAQIKNRFFER